MFKLFNVQKKIILKLAKEVHTYLMDRVKKDEYSTETEIKFEELFEKIQDNPDL